MRGPLLANLGGKRPQAVLKWGRRKTLQQDFAKQQLFFRGRFRVGQKDSAREYRLLTIQARSLGDFLKLRAHPAFTGLSIENHESMVFGEAGPQLLAQRRRVRPVFGRSWRFEIVFEQPLANRERRFHILRLRQHVYGWPLGRIYRGRVGRASSSALRIQSLLQDFFKLMRKKLQDLERLARPGFADLFEQRLLLRFDRLQIFLDPDKPGETSIALVPGGYF